MAEVKEKERDYFNQLAGMVDEMTPNDIYATVQGYASTGTHSLNVLKTYWRSWGNEETFREGY